MGAASPQQVRSRGKSSFDTRAVLRDIARPRLVGSEQAEEVAAVIRGHFESLGYRTQARDFQFNPWPGRIGIAVAGGAYLVAAFAAAGFLHAGNPFAALVLLLLLVIVAAAIYLFAAPLIDLLPFSRMTGTNMMFTPASGRPRYLIMAHRDSKSQPVPLSFRGPAVVLALVVWLGMLAAALIATARPLATWLILALGFIGVAAGLILLFCYVTNESPGALDNASGVTAALAIAARERDASDVAFLITDAEELGLAGSRAAATTLPPVFGVINLDGLDDDGPVRVCERFGFPRRQGLAPHLAAALLEQAAASGVEADRSDVPFGIALDHMPVVRAGVPALTIMKGTLASLKRVHRPTDSVENLRGDGIDTVVDLVCGALHRLRTQAALLERS